MTKITKAEFDALPDSLKTKFKADGDNYVLEENTEDVEGLKKSKADILAEKKRIQDERDELAKFKAEHEAATATAEEEKAKAAGDFEKVLASKEAAWQARIDAATAKEATILANLKAERIKTLCAEKGILPERVVAAMAVGDLDNIFELESTESGFSLKKKGGIGDATEVDAIFNDLKTKADYVFAANGASGSGASGSGNGNGLTPTNGDLSATARLEKFYTESAK